MREFNDADRSLVTRRRLLKVDVKRELATSPAAAWAVISDHRTWPEWHEDYVEHATLTEQTMGLGTTFASREWWKLRSESEITHWLDGSAVGLTLRRANVWRWLITSQYNEIEVEPVGGDPSRSVVHFRAGFTGTILFWLLAGYTVGQAVGLTWINAHSSLKKLEKLLLERQNPAASGDASAR